MIQRICGHCAKQFNFRGCPTDVTTGRGKYCSRSCVNKSLYQPIHIFCQYCKKEIVKRRKLTQKHCSQPCAYKARVGSILPDVTRVKISLALKGKKPKNFGNQFKPWGKDNNNWKGGLTKLADKIRKSESYKQWRKTVFERDGYTCVWCNQIGGELNADHIRSFANFPESRFDINNGRTLCVPCHKGTETYLNRWTKN